MDIFQVRQELKNKTIYDIPLRVTFYARVSSEKDNQLNSLDNQIAYYKDLITKNQNWTYVDGYIDEGISGITTKKRENFNAMISDGKLGKFDYIITKEITRFARNTLDSIMYTRQLLQYGVAVFFQSDNINTIEPDAELRLTIMSGIAQDESRKLSTRIKFGHAQSIKRGVVMGNSNIFGYKKDNGKLVVDSEQAAFVQELFEKYATNEYSMKELEDYFWNKGYRNTKGNIISHSTMSNIIKNPKYKGYYVGGKVEIIDMFTKKQKFIPKDEWIMYKDEEGETVPQIISEELWNKANNVLESRSDIVKNKNTSLKKENLFTGKIICKQHNVPFYKKQNIKTNKVYDPFWKCKHKIEHGSDSCGTFVIYESELMEILTDVIKEVTPNLDNILNSYIEYIIEEFKDEKALQMIEELQQKIEIVEKKKEKLLDLAIDDRLSNAEFEKRNNMLNAELSMLKSKLNAEKEKDILQHDPINEINKIKIAAKEVFSNNKISYNKNSVDKLIDKIYVTAQEEDKMTLEIKLNIPGLDEIKAIYSRNKLCRSGHTFKKMIQAYENNMK